MHFVPRIQSVFAFATKPFVISPIRALAGRAAVCYIQAARAQEKVSTPTTPTTSTKFSDANQIECDVTIVRYFGPRSHRDVAPHQLLLALGDASLLFDFAFDLPDRHTLTRHLEVHDVAAQTNDCHGRHGEAMTSASLSLIRLL